MNTNMPKNTNTKYKFKKVYSLRIKLKLKELGFEPLLETDNIYKPPLKCWVFLDTPDFEEALGSIITGGQKNG